MIKLVTNDLKSDIKKCFDQVEEDIYIVSPFLSIKTADMLCKIIQAKDVDCIIITRCYIRDFVQGVNSLEAIKKMVDAGIEVYALEGLHAKLYIFDQEKVILGSANFTLAGLKRNIELSVMTDETSVTIPCSEYFSLLLSHCQNNSGRVDEKMISEMQEAYKDAYKDRQKDAGTESRKTYGATRYFEGITKKLADWKDEDFKIEDHDDVYSLLFSTKEKDVRDFNYNVWAKFEGDSSNRFAAYEKHSLTKVEMDGEPTYVINFSRKPGGVKTGDRVYLIALILDENGKNSTRIVGRGFAKVYQNRNIVPENWINEFGFKWMRKYKYFCVLTGVELLDMNRVDCPSLIEVYDKLGKNTYVSTIDKETVDNMNLVQCRRSHLQMTLDAMKYIDQRFAEISQEYGFQTDIKQRVK